MWTRSLVTLATVLWVALLCPDNAAARRVAGTGSLIVTHAAGPLTWQLAATALTTNPGMEKTMTQQLPLAGGLWVLHYFVNQDTVNPAPNDMDTILLLTNLTGVDLPLNLTLRDLAGNIVAAPGPTLNPYETKVIKLSEVLP